MKIYLIKSKYNIVKTTNSTRAYPLVVIDTNLIGYKVLAGIDATKYAEIIASIFSSSSVGILVYANYSTKHYDTKRESSRHKCDKERTNLMILERDLYYHSSCSI